MPRPSKAAAAEKKAEIHAAMAPVREALAKRSVMLQAIDEHDAATAAAIEKLIEVSGVAGPFKFGGDVVVFRKSPTNGHYDVHPYKVKTVIGE